MTLISLYFLGVLASQKNDQYEIFVVPVVALLVYSLISLCRAVRGSSWLYGEDTTYTTYGNGNYNGYNGNYNGYNGGSRNYNTSYTQPKPKENVTTYKEEPPKPRNIEKRTIKTYPDKKKVLAEIERLKRNPFWRLKRWVCNLWGVDITAKMWEPEVTYEYVEIHNDKEDDSRFMPNNNGKAISKPFWGDAEYNRIVNKVGRSFEVAIVEDGMKIVIEDETETETQ